MTMMLPNKSTTEDQRALLGSKKQNPSSERACFSGGCLHFQCECHISDWPTELCVGTSSLHLSLTAGETVGSRPQCPKGSLCLPSPALALRKSGSRLSRGEMHSPCEALLRPKMPPRPDKDLKGD